MGCNCKNTSVDLQSQKIETKSKNKIVNSILNFITFLLVFSIAIVVVIPFVIYVLFKSIVLRDNTVNMSSLFLKFAKKLMEKDNDDDDDDELDYELYDNSDYELTDVDTVNNLETIK
jgi:hypothetical protein